MVTDKPWDFRGKDSNSKLSLQSSHMTSKIALGMDIAWQMGEGEGAHLHGGLGQGLGVLKEVFITFAHIVLPGSQTHGREVVKGSCMPRSCVWWIGSQPVFAIKYSAWIEYGSQVTSPLGICVSLSKVEEGAVGRE